MVRITDGYPGLKASRRDVVIDLLRRVVGSYTLGRLVIPIIDLECDVTLLPTGRLCRKLFDFARRNSEDGWREPCVFPGYNVRAEYGLEAPTLDLSSPVEYFALGTAEQLRNHAATVWDKIQNYGGGGLAESKSANRKLMLSLWKSSLGQGRHDEVAFVWFSPVRPSTWSYMQICGDTSRFSEPTKETIQAGECTLSFDGGKLGLDLREWQRSVPSEHCAFVREFEKMTVRRSVKHVGDWQKHHWDEVAITPFGDKYDAWILGNTRSGALTLHGGHAIRCYTDANLLVGRLAPIHRGYGAYGRMLYLALDWASGCVTAIQLNAIGFETFLRLAPQARVLLRHGLGL